MRSGLRIRVNDVLDRLPAGVDRDEILTAYLLLEDGDIIAALEYAPRQSDHLVLRIALSRGLMVTREGFNPMGVEIRIDTAWIGLILKPDASGISQDRSL